MMKNSNDQDYKSKNDVSIQTIINAELSMNYHPTDLYGDKNIFCTCPSMDEFKEDAA